MADEGEVNYPPHLDRFWMHCTTHMHGFLIKSIHRKPSITFSAIPHTKFYLQCKIWDKLWHTWDKLTTSSTVDKLNDRSRSTPRQYRGQWCQLSVKKVFDNLFKRAFWVIDSRYFFDRIYIWRLSVETSKNRSQSLTKRTQEFGIILSVIMASPQVL